MLWFLTKFRSKNDEFLIKIPHAVDVKKLLPPILILLLGFLKQLPDFLCIFSWFDVCTCCYTVKELPANLVYYYSWETCLIIARVTSCNANYSWSTIRDCTQCQNGKFSGYNMDFEISNIHPYKIAAITWTSDLPCGISNLVSGLRPEFAMRRGRCFTLCWHLYIVVAS